MILLSLGVGCAPDGDKGMASKWGDPSDRRNSPNVDPSKVTDAPAPHISPMTHFAAGNMLERQNDLEGAIEQYERALAGAPRMIQAYNRLGIAYQKLGKFDDAERILRQGVRLHPDSAMLHNNLGFCFLQKGSYSDAEAEVRAALKQVPQFSRARMNLGIALARSDCFDDAAVEFSRVVSGEAAFYNVALVCMDRHAYAAAEKALRRSLKVNPAYTPAMAELAKVTKLLKTSQAAAADSSSTAAMVDGRGWRWVEPSKSVSLAAQASGRNEETP